MAAAARACPPSDAPRQGGTHAQYLITGSYTAEGAKGVLAEGGSGRVAAVKKLLASVGGTVESFHFAFGGDDFYVIVDVPSQAAVAAASMVVAASGGASPRTIVLLTPEEVDAAVKLTPSYRAPGA